MRVYKCAVHTHYQIVLSSVDNLCFSGGAEFLFDKIKKLKIKKLKRQTDTNQNGCKSDTASIQATHTLRETVVELNNINKLLHG